MHNAATLRLEADVPRRVPTAFTMHNAQFTMHNAATLRLEADVPRRVPTNN